MSISIPILVFPPGEPLIKMRFKVPIDFSEVKGQMTVIFTNCIDFALLPKEFIASIFDRKIRRKVGFGYL